MKRLNPQTQKPFKYGNIREDGYVFVCYRTNIVKRNGYSAEYWTKPECFKRNNERALINNKKWHKQNLEKVSEKASRKRAQKLNATPPWLNETQKTKISEVYKKCAEISSKTGISHHVDHIVPLKSNVVCGLHVPWNLQILTASENCAKSNNFNLEF